MTTPDTTTEEPTEQEEALYEAVATTLEDITGRWRDGEIADMLTALREPIAAITRQAVADALTEQSRSLAKLGGFMREQARAHVAKGNDTTAVGYDAMADTYYSSANKLTKAAADKIAEGYEFECAAFAQECDQRVPDAGDYCAKHEPEDDEDRWAE